MTAVQKQLPHYGTTALPHYGTAILEKLVVPNIVKQFPAFYRTRRFITALSWTRSIQSTISQPISSVCILILSIHLRLGFPSGLFPSGFRTKTVHSPLLSPIHAIFSAHFIPLYSITRIIFGEEFKNNAPHCVISSIPLLPRPSWGQISSSAPCSQPMCLPQSDRPSFTPVQNTANWRILCLLIFIF